MDGAHPFVGRRRVSGSGYRIRDLGGTLFGFHTTILPPKLTQLLHATNTQSATNGLIAETLGYGGSACMPTVLSSRTEHDESVG